MSLTKHGDCGTPEYIAYCDAKARCNNPNKNVYKYYGGRGIEFKFNDYEDFINHIGKKPSADYSLDRIDPDGHYEVGNVRWTDWSTQMKNRREYDKDWLIGNQNNAKQFLITHPNGEKEEVLNMAKFCKEHGLDKSNLHSTIKHPTRQHKGYRAEVI